MKIEFIKRGAATRLILLFAGWSTDPRYYYDCVVVGWDKTVESDYPDMSVPQNPSQNSTIYIFAYSLGVWAAAQCGINATAKIAICGSEMPVSDQYGIPEAVYYATAEGLTVDSLKKFHRRMGGDRDSINRIQPLLPVSPDVEALKDELYAIAAAQGKVFSESRWDRAYIAEQDRIFPCGNLEAFWNQRPEVVMVKKSGSHAIDISQIIKEVIPDHSAIGEAFSSAYQTYNAHAVVQKEICCRMGEIIFVSLSERSSKIDSLLEIGVGQGLLTNVWQKLIHPSKATYIDLVATPKFGFSPSEEYLVADAEEWLKNSSEKYDVILSASTIQWFADPIGFIQTIKNHLNPDGFAVISTFTKGNLHELDAIRPCPLIYHTAEEYKEIPNVIVEEWAQPLSFSSIREMLMHIRHTGVAVRHQSSSAPLSIFPTKLTYQPLILFLKAT